MCSCILCKNLHTRISGRWRSIWSRTSSGRDWWCRLLVCRPLPLLMWRRRSTMCRCWCVLWCRFPSRSWCRVRILLLCWNRRSSRRRSRRWCSRLRRTRSSIAIVRRSRNRRCCGPRARRIRGVVELRARRAWRSWVWCLRGGGAGREARVMN